MSWRAQLARLMVACVVAAAAACSPAKEQFKTYDITGAAYAQKLSLTDQNGVRRQLSDYRGRVVVIFFGYTQCPDACPTTMVDLAGAMKKLGAQANDVQVLFVTIDPARDTGPVLARYVPNFDSRFLGLWGSDAETAAAAREFKVFYQKVDGPSADSYSMDHTAQTYVLDRRGQPRLVMPLGTSSADMAHDLKILLDEPSP